MLPTGGAVHCCRIMACPLTNAFFSVMFYPGPALWVPGGEASASDADLNCTDIEFLKNKKQLCNVTLMYSTLYPRVMCPQIKYNALSSFVIYRVIYLCISKNTLFFQNNLPSSATTTLFLKLPDIFKMFELKEFYFNEAEIFRFLLLSYPSSPQQERDEVVDPVWWGSRSGLRAQARTAAVPSSV